MKLLTKRQKIIKLQKKKIKKEIIIKTFNQDQFQMLVQKIQNNSIQQFQKQQQDNKKEQIVDQKIQDYRQQNEKSSPIQIVEKDLSKKELNEIKINSRKEKRKEYMKKLKQDLPKQFDEESRTIFIGNLEKNVSVQDLKDFFQEDLIEDCRLLKDKDGKSKGIAFIDFIRPEDARFAVDKNGSDIKGKQIKVDISQTKKKLN